MIHLWLPLTLAAVLAGAGVHGILARRNAVLVLVGVELVLAAAGLILVTIGARGAVGDLQLQSGQVLTLFVITIAAAEICVALAIVLAMFRLQGHVDLTAVPDTEDRPRAATAPPPTGAPAPRPTVPTAPLPGSRP